MVYMCPWVPLPARDRRLLGTKAENDQWFHQVSIARKRECQRFPHPLKKSARKNLYQGGGNILIKTFGFWNALLPLGLAGNFRTESNA